MGIVWFSAPYQLDFMKDKDVQVVCKKHLSKDEVTQFQSVVSKGYYFQMYYDDLPIWGFIGKVDKEGKEPSQYKYYLYKHTHFDILYNNDRVIDINARTNPDTLVDLTEDKVVDVGFVYSAKWKETYTPFEKRMDKYMKSSFWPHHLEIHWFSIVNSCVTFLLLTGFLAMILMRVLKNNFVKYAHDEETAEDPEETGQKYVHGDVFRFPAFKSLCTNFVSPPEWALVVSCLPCQNDTLQAKMISVIVAHEYLHSDPLAIIGKRFFKIPNALSIAFLSDECR